MPLSLPVYLRGKVWTLHTRIDGKQVKRSLRTSSAHIATMRAVHLLESLAMPLPPSLDDALKAAQSGKKYEIDLSRGIVKADGPEDHARLMQALQSLPAPVSIARQPPAPKSTLTLTALLEKFFSFRDHLTEATRIDYGTNVAEFEKLFPDLTLDLITDDVVTQYIEKLKAKGNTGKTVDKKVACLRSLFNFAIKQKIFLGQNPASDRRLAPKSKGSAGQKPFLENDLQAVFARDEFKKFKQSHLAFYLILRLGLVTGMRVSSAASLAEWQMKITIAGAHYIDIDDDKTPSGRRDVPIPKSLWEEIKDFLVTHKTFGFTERKGKGYSDEIRNCSTNTLRALAIKAKNSLITVSERPSMI